MEQRSDVLVAVFETRQQAEATARRLHDAGAPAGSVRLDDPRDEVTSMQGEMVEEMQHTWLSPQAAVALDKEGARAMTVLMPVAVVVGALVLAPFAFVDWGLSLVARLVITTVCGAVAGATVAAILAGGLGAKGSAERLGAEKGVSLRVMSPTAAVEAALLGAGALRVDRFDASGMPTGTPVSAGVEGVVDSVKAGVVDLREGAAEEERSPQEADEAAGRQSQHR